MDAPEQTREFDAQIVAVFDQPSVQSNPEGPSPPLLWIDREHICPVDMKVHWMLMEGRITAADFAYFARYAGDALVSVPDPLLEAVLYGRVRLTMLLNQRGGNVLSLFNMADVAGHVHHGGGAITSMTTLRAHSAIAHMTEMGDRRIALPHTDHMWHAQHDGTGSASCNVAERSHEIMEMFRQTIRPQCVPHMEQRFREAMDDPSNPLNDVYMSGSELHEWGFVHQLVPSAWQMEEQFQRETGIPVDLQAWRQDPIARFFLRSRMEEWALLNHGLRVEFYNEKLDRFSYGIPARQERQFANDDHLDAIISLTREKFKEYF